MAYFEPTSSERRGLIVLCLALVLALGVGGYVYISRDAAPSPQPDQPRTRRQPRYYAQPVRQAETFDFDPNEADSTALLRLGFAPYQVRGIYKYRAMGGRYHEADDVKRIPGMTNELWERLHPHIRISRKYQYVEVEHPAHVRQQQTETHEEQTVTIRDTMRYPVKLNEGSVLSLNDADTAALKKVPGIGSYFARRIVDYRNRLGGYVSLSQLQEIEGMPEDVERWFTLNTDSIRRIDVNHATKNQLVRHPYLRVYRARAIWDHRHNIGPLHGIDDLRRLPDFSEEDVLRLEPYLEFR